MADKVKKTDPAVERWLACIATYEREFKRWEGRSDKIVKKFRDDVRYTTRDSGGRFNILWSNVQTASSAVFSRLPQPDVSRRFKDNDPVGRVAALLLERGLDFEISHYSDYREAMTNCVQDRFLGGRGTSWVRYEPKTKPVEQPEEAEGESEVQVTEDIEAPDEQLQDEQAPSDYVHWKDFGHSVARTWEEVTAVWRKVYMGRKALVERFGEELGSKIPLDTKPETPNKQYGTESQQYEALVYEIWDREAGNALWLSKSMGQILDEKPDPLELDNFWPCPKPLFATLTNETLVPVPDFSLYQDQANTLDVLADRVDGLVKALQVKGVYDATIPELERLFTEGQNTTLYPVKNWQAFAEKQGLKNAIDLVDLEPIYGALKACFEAMEQQKQQIYEITGLADIIRGSTDPNETATAQKLKGSFGSMRLRSMQKEVAQFATEVLQIKAQVMCRQFQPETLAKIGGAAMLSKEDQQLVPQALQLLKSSDLRDFRIEIVADSMIYMDEQQEKQDRTEMLTAVGNFLKEAVPAVTQTPQIGPLMCDMLKFAVTGFKVGKTIEGAFDQFADLLKQGAQNPQPKPDPEMAKIQSQERLQQQELSGKQQLAQFEAMLDARTEQAKQQYQAQQAAQENRLEAAREQQKAQFDAHLLMMKATFDAQQSARDTDFKRWEAILDAKTKVAVAEIAKAGQLQSAQLQAATAEAQGGAVPASPKPAPQPQGAANAPV